MPGRPGTGAEVGVHMQARPSPVTTPIGFAPGLGKIMTSSISDWNYDISS